MDNPLWASASLLIASPPTAAAGWLAEAPTPPVQQTVLDALRAEAAQVLHHHGIHNDFSLRPGLRMRRSFGNCRHIPNQPPVITVRCTNGGGAWRPRGAIMLTLLHEMAHLKYRGHGPRFWRLHRSMVQHATATGAYIPAEDDAAEHAQGNSKLAGSPAHERAHLAGAERRRRWVEARTAVAQWRPGDMASITGGRGQLSGAQVCVVRVNRTRVIAALPDGRQFSVPAALLTPLPA
jgi:hypothetical protein